MESIWLIHLLSKQLNMADVNNQGSSSGKKSVRKTKRKSTKIDMTAMVDVAFLLLTFFVLTATMSDAYVMEVVKPPKCEGPDCGLPIDEEKILTLILEDNDEVSYYHGNDLEGLETTDFSDSGIRKAILTHLRRHPELCSKTENKDGCWDPIFVIKPKKESKYSNLVDILDEMAITDAKKYAIGEYTNLDSLAFASLESPVIAAVNP